MATHWKDDNAKSKPLQKKIYTLSITYLQQDPLASVKETNIGEDCIESCAPSLKSTETSPVESCKYKIQLTIWML